MQLSKLATNPKTQIRGAVLRCAALHCAVLCSWATLCCVTVLYLTVLAALCCAAPLVCCEKAVQIFKGREGLGDRMQQLLYIISYVRRTGRVLVVDWQDGRSKQQMRSSPFT